MTILHVLTSIDPAHGGTVEAVRHMASAMSRRGVRAEVLSLAVPHPDWLNGWPVKVHCLGGTFSDYRYTRRLVPWLERNYFAYDAIVVHGVWRYSSLGVWQVLRRKSTPYFLFTHGMLNPWFKRAYPVKHAKKSAFWRLFEHRVFRDARSVLFANEQERKLARQSFQPYQCCEQVVGLGIAEPPGDETSQLSHFFQTFPHLRGKRLVLFLGRIHRNKGCDLLIQAFAAVAPADALLRLVIAGPDEDGLRPELQRIAAAHQVADRIIWTGNLGRDSKWGAFRAAEVFVLPSHAENFGVAIVEALACGVPVLITDKVNIWREIAEDNAGLTASDDIGGVTGLLHRWCSLEQEQKHALGANARRCYRKRFELDGSANRFIDYLSTATADAAKNTL